MMTIYLRNLRNYWNQCKQCSAVYTSQCLTLVLHLISTLAYRLLKGSGNEYHGHKIGWFPDSWIIFVIKTSCVVKMLKKDVRTVISRMLLFSLPKQSCEVKTLCFGDMSQFSNVNYCELRNVIQRKESVKIH